jgi:hypothetical protein
MLAASRMLWRLTVTKTSMSSSIGRATVEPTEEVVGLYRQQVRDYLAATGAKSGLLVFVTSGRVERVMPG